MSSKIAVITRQIFRGSRVRDEQRGLPALSQASGLTLPRREEYAH
jgi:hypothetical protein